MKRMNKVIFLDIDGVLNTERHHEYCYKKNLEMLPEQRDSFVQINPVIGISEEDATKAIKILNT